MTDKKTVFGFKKNCSLVPKLVVCLKTPVP